MPRFATSKDLRQIVCAAVLLAVFLYGLHLIDQMHGPRDAHTALGVYDLLAAFGAACIANNMLTR